MWILLVRLPLTWGSVIIALENISERLLQNILVEFTLTQNATPEDQEWVASGVIFPTRKQGSNSLQRVEMIHQKCGLLVTFPMWSWRNIWAHAGLRAKSPGVLFLLWVSESGSAPRVGTKATDLNRNLAQNNHHFQNSNKWGVDLDIGPHNSFYELEVPSKSVNKWSFKF